MNQPISKNKCNHQFWADRNPAGCFNCGKTEEEIFKENYQPTPESKERDEFIPTKYIKELKKEIEEPESKDWEKEFDEKFKFDCEKPFAHSTEKCKGLKNHHFREDIKDFIRSEKKKSYDLGKSETEIPFYQIKNGEISKIEITKIALDDIKYQAKEEMKKDIIAWAKSEKVSKEDGYKDNDTRDRIYDRGEKHGFNLALDSLINFLNKTK